MSRLNPCTWNSRLETGGPKPSSATRTASSKHFEKNAAQLKLAVELKIAC